MLPQIFHDTEASDSPFSQSAHHSGMIGGASPTLPGYGLPGVHLTRFLKRQKVFVKATLATSTGCLSLPMWGLPLPAAGGTL